MNELLSGYFRATAGVSTVLLSAMAISLSLKHDGGALPLAQAHSIFELKKLLLNTPGVVIRAVAEANSPWWGAGYDIEVCVDGDTSYTLYLPRWCVGEMRPTTTAAVLTLWEPPPWSVKDVMTIWGYVWRHAGLWRRLGLLGLLPWEWYDMLKAITLYSVLGFIWKD